MSRYFITWLTLLLVGLNAAPAFSARHYISTNAIGQSYAYDPAVKRWQPIADPKEYVANLYRQQRPEGFGGVIQYKDWAKAPTATQSAAGAAANGVSAATSVAERIPLVNRVTGPTKDFLMRRFNPPPK